MPPSRRHEPYRCLRKKRSPDLSVRRAPPSPPMSMLMRGTLASGFGLRKKRSKPSGQRGDPPPTLTPGGAGGKGTNCQGIPRRAFFRKHRNHMKSCMVPVRQRRRRFHARCVPRCLEVCGCWRSLRSCVYASSLARLPCNLAGAASRHTGLRASYRLYIGYI